ncbi:hypothetical protein MTR_0238s0020 [Medicago truncatula]|uniref:Uncharacterized protein n=1 Tax=Medicago truncatula TaxID=3880 RepID=G7ZV93_MEDTR|nr:hypothetical protein MTR_0238s0020 [Medicago truncatula]
MVTTENSDDAQIGNYDALAGSQVREYDARSAVEAAVDASAGFMPVLTRNQKQKLKVQHVLSKKPSKSRARGDNKSTDQ